MRSEEVHNEILDCKSYGLQIKISSCPIFCRLNFPCIHWRTTSYLYIAWIFSERRIIHPTMKVNYTE